MRAAISLGLAWALQGCATDCGGVWDPLDRDWCWSDAAAGAAEGGDLSRASRLLDKVSSDRVRAATTERVITASPPGLDRAGAVALCSDLATANAARCLSNWDRAESWGAP